MNKKDRTCGSFVGLGSTPPLPSASIGKPLPATQGEARIRDKVVPESSARLDSTRSLTVVKQSVSLRTDVGLRWICEFGKYVAISNIMLPYCSDSRARARFTFCAIAMKIN